jgi:hypothetical protein
LPTPPDLTIPSGSKGRIIRDLRKDDLVGVLFDSPRMEVAVARDSLTLAGGAV